MVAALGEACVTPTAEASAALGAVLGKCVSHNKTADIVY